jgi:hypothetical protein
MSHPAFLESDIFKSWQNRARAKREELLRAQNPKSSFDERIWQDFKNEILIPSVGRCAYCEGRYSAGEFGDAEHYRPKSEVTEDRKAINHPGYYWLAYEWHNLLLCCKKCNSRHPDRDQKTRASHPGKLCEFPVKARRISAPTDMPDRWIEELQQEEPLLLNLYFDNPCHHFEARKRGWIWHKAERGRVTIEVCHLNRKELREERELAEEQLRFRAAHIWANVAHCFEQDRYGDKDAFSTYLNYKLSEELRKRAAEILRCLDAVVVAE